jgi:transketolase
MKSTRDAYGEVLAALGSDERVVVLSPDLGHSTKVSEFAKKYPERFIECGISEQDIIGMAAGLSICGKIPFVSTFSVFGCGRGWEQIRNSVAMDSLNVKLVFTHAGLGVGEDGASHQMLEDIAIMSALPNMMVMSPADAIEAREMVKFAKNHRGPVYIRLYRQDMPYVFDEQYRFDPSEYPVLNHGSGIAILAMGDTVHEALQVGRKIGATVVDLHTVKPLNTDFLVELAKNHKRIVTIEDHNIIGGMGSIVASSLAERFPIPVLRIGVRDKFGQTGKPDELFDFYGLSHNKIIEQIEKWCLE